MSRIGRVAGVAVLVAGVILAVNASPALAGPALGEHTPDMVGVLRMLAQGVGVGAVVAFLFERLKWFQALSGEAKWWTILGISMGLPILAQLALQFTPAEMWAIMEPYWQAIASGFLAWAGAQGVHLVHRALTPTS